MVQIVGLAGHALDQLYQTVAVVGMRSREDEVHRRLRRTIECEDAMRLLGPHDLAGGRLPPEAAGDTQTLRFRQIGLRLLEIAVEASVFQRDRGLRGEQREELDARRREHV